MRVAIVVPGQGAYAADGEYLITAACRDLVAEAGRLAGRLGPVGVVFTGFSPNGGPTEAEQMRDAWAGPAVELVLEPTASITAQNASRTLPLLVERNVDRAVVVCAWTHLARTRLFFGRVYAAAGVKASFHAVRTRPSLRAIAWELAALPLSPSQLRAARAEVRR